MESTTSKQYVQKSVCRPGFISFFLLSSVYEPCCGGLMSKNGSLNVHSSGCVGGWRELIGSTSLHANSGGFDFGFYFGIFFWLIFLVTASMRAI